MTLEGAGGALPPFQASSLVPEEPRLTTWDLAAMKLGELRLRRDGPLTVEWVPQRHDVLLLLLQDGPPPRSYLHLVWCVFPGWRGTGTVPLAAMERLDEQSRIRIGNLYFASIVLQRWSAGSTAFEASNWNGRGVRATWE